MKIHKLRSDGVVIYLSLVEAWKELKRFGFKFTKEQCREKFKNNQALKVSTIHGDIVYTTDLETTK